MFKKKAFEVFVFDSNVKMIGTYKTEIVPNFGDNLHADFLFPGSPNYIIHKRVLLSQYKQKINVFVFEVLKLNVQASKEKLTALLPFL